MWIYVFEDIYTKRYCLKRLTRRLRSLLFIHHSCLTQFIYTPFHMDTYPWQKLILGYLWFSGLLADTLCVGLVTGFNLTDFFVNHIFAYWWNILVLLFRSLISPFVRFCRRSVKSMSITRHFQALRIKSCSICGKAILRKRRESEFTVSRKYMTYYNDYNQRVELYCNYLSEEFW